MSTVPSGTRFIGIASSVDLTERKSAVLNKQTEPFTIEDIASTIGPGPIGPQGPIGLTGAPGAVGPAGLEWQGEWISGTSYVKDDAVGDNGSSWFCTLATSGTTAPHLDDTHWALLASQGATGPAGAQGPIGPQGPAGTTGNITQDNEVYSTLSPFTQIVSDVNWVISTGPSQRVLLPLGAAIGKEIIVYAFNNPYTFQVRADLLGSTAISITGIETFSNFVTVSPNENYKFTSLGDGQWKAEAIGPNLQQITNIGNTIVSGTNKTTLPAGALILENTSSLNSTIILSNGTIQLTKNNLGLKTATISQSANATANRTITLPDASGTVALQTYKSYRAVINNNSVVNVLIDEIGFTLPVITNPSNGEILITKTGFFTSINNNKLDLITSTVNDSGTPFVCTLEKYDLFPNNSLILNVFNMNGTQTGTPSCNFTIEIRVYA